MAEVRLSSSLITGDTNVKILCKSVTVSGSTNTTKTPDANGTDIVEVQTQSFENLKYVLNGVHFTNDDDVLTYRNMLELYKAKYDGVTQHTLTVTYGALVNGSANSDSLVSTDVSASYQNLTTLYITGTSTTGKLVNSVRLKGLTSDNGTNCMMKATFYYSDSTSDVAYTTTGNTSYEEKTIISLSPTKYVHKIVFEVKSEDNGVSVTAKEPVVKYAKRVEQNLIYSSDLTTTAIPVVLETFSFPISTENSKDGYLPVGSMTFVETK